MARPGETPSRRQVVDAGRHAVAELEAASLPESGTVRTQRPPAPCIARGYFVGGGLKPLAILPRSQKRAKRFQFGSSFRRAKYKKREHLEPCEAFHLDRLLENGAVER